MKTCPAHSTKDLKGSIKLPCLSVLELLAMERNSPVSAKLLLDALEKDEGWSSSYVRRLANREEKISLGYWLVDEKIKFEPIPDLTLPEREISALEGFWESALAHFVNRQNDEVYQSTCSAHLAALRAMKELLKTENDLQILTIASHLILNLKSPKGRCLGGISPLLNQLDTINPALKKFYQALKDLPSQCEAVATTAFCIDLGNLVFPRFIDAAGEPLPKFTNLRDVEYLAALLGRGGILNISHWEFRCRFSTFTRILKCPETNPKDQFEIKDGYLTHIKSGEQIEFEFDLRIKEPKNLSNEPEPRAETNPLYYLEKMEELYQYGELVIEKKTKLFRQNPMYQKLVCEIPPECALLNSTKYSLDHDAAINSKRYFDSLPEGNFPRSSLVMKYSGHEFIVNCEKHKNSSINAMTKWPIWTKGDTEKEKFNFEAALSYATQFKNFYLTKFDILKKSGEALQYTSEIEKYHEELKKKVKGWSELGGQINWVDAKKTFLEFLDDVDYCYFRMYADHHFSREIQVPDKPIADHYVLSDTGCRAVKAETFDWPINDD